MIIKISKINDVFQLRKLNLVIFLLYILIIIFFLGKFIHQIVKGYDYQSYQVTEMLINYRGGFVRRGLCGDIIWILHYYLGCSPYWTSCMLCVLCFIVVSAFFIAKSVQRKVSLLYFPLVYIIIINILRRDWFRKDCFMLLAFITCLYLIRNLIIGKKSYLITGMLVNFVCSFVLLIHEAFFFFSIPLLGLFIFRCFALENSKISSILKTFLFFLPSLSIFFVVTMFKGNEFVALDIWKSWGGSNFWGISTPTNAVDAIGWSTEYAVNKHINANFIGSYIDHGVRIVNKNILWLFCLILTYLMTFKWNVIQLVIDTKYKDMNKSYSMACLLIFQFIMLIPMFTILSCDYARIYYYLFGSCFSVILIFEDNIILSLFPNRFVTTISRIIGR